MAETPIQKAREKFAKALAKLPAVGLRTDWTLVIRRLDDAEDADDLSMDPADAREPVAGSELPIAAPDVKAYSGFAMLAIQQAAGGLIEVGDHRVKFPRTAEVEAFLSSVEGENDGTGGPYPQMTRFVFVLNGEDYRPVRWIPGPLFLEAYVRKIGG